MVSCGDDSTLRLWNSETGDLLLTIDALPDGALSWVRFSADGETVAAGGPAGQAVIWDLSYFDRHIAGNVAYQVARLADELGAELDAAAISAWAQEVLARPWPRFVPSAPPSGR